MKQLIAVSSVFLLFITACKTLTLQPANFSWPIESVLPVDKDGNVTEERYSIEFKTTGLFFEEFQDSLAYMGKELRVIRDNKGYYFITSTNFKNVYVFKAYDGTMKQKNKILISETGMENPVFNQRDPYIELIDGITKLNLTHEGIEGGSK
jgi:hypothetical protein